MIEDDGHAAPAVAAAVADQATAQAMYYYYVGWFGALLCSLFIFRQLTARTKKADSNAAVSSDDFVRFQYKYITVYLIMMAADWMQGPYVYALYQYYNLNIAEIGFLFIVGFGSSLIFGTFIGSAADMYGRKRLCIIFGILYSFSCMTKHFPDYNILLVGRLLGGISTSILFSSFESWMVHEHHAAGYSDEWLGLTFSIATSGNGIVAIGSGVIASLVTDKWGRVAPFDVSLILLIFGTLIVAFTWSENYGDVNINLMQTVSTAYHRMRVDSRIVYLGIAQSFFEGAMFIFVFMWTPTLEETNPFLSHGWIFASFMICVLIGSSVFAYCTENHYNLETITLYMFGLAAISLFLPAFTTSHTLQLICFFIFEACVGMFWPCLGTMRGKYVPEDVRATVMNLFRVPLNIIVVLVLINIKSLSQLQVWSTCATCITLAFFAQWKIKQSLILGDIVPSSDVDDMPLKTINTSAH